MISKTVNRREFLRLSAAAGAVTAAGSLLGCGVSDPIEPTMEGVTLASRPGAFSGTAPRGFHWFNIWRKDDAFLYVPPTYQDSRPAPFLLLLHGAGGKAANFVANLPSRVDDKGIVVLALDSSDRTWDRFVIGGFGPDIARIDLALGYAFRKANIDPARLGIGGFSDGASYALSVGIPNGDLFTAMIAFSPGVVYAPGTRGKPRAFISHGTGDAVIPFANSSEVIVPQLREAGYSVTFREFTGGHSVPAEVANEAYEWLLSS
ncbi:MAG TPA: twin-arginine translocation signal domain-containing protein [Gemmatimonadaceae bacterium]|nr:twin-arginine translocation signal domain-containing protein [Gemmatimonadaceae bacterium]